MFHRGEEKSLPTQQKKKKEEGGALSFRKKWKENPSPRSLPRLKKKKKGMATARGAGKEGKRKRGGGRNAQEKKE